MKVNEFDFALPNDRIALEPVEPRDLARLLVVDPSSGFSDAHVRDLFTFVSPKDVLVINNTRVIPARLNGLRHRGASTIKVEVMLHKREDSTSWLAFARPGKKLAIGDEISFYPRLIEDGVEIDRLFHAKIIEKRLGGEILVRFSASGTELDQLISKIGHMPLPPYIASKRATDERDEHHYQTIFAEHAGAVAAPTAGLHFTEGLMTSLREIGVRLAPITLHVGAGTFLPVTVDDTEKHVMHSEYGEISSETAEILNSARASGGRIIAVGTTSLRVLEASVGNDGRFSRWSGDIDLFITPGYVFRAVDVLMTNFHLPKSTLFMLVSAFSGLETMKNAYQHAIDRGYRFYSYGDASLLFPERLKV